MNLEDINNTKWNSDEATEHMKARNVKTSNKMAINKRNEEWVCVRLMGEVETRKQVGVKVKQLQENSEQVRRWI